MAYDREKDPQILRHREAMAAPRPGFERAIALMLEGFEEYRRAHAAEYEDGIGADGVLGNEWAALGNALHGLLNGDTGRFDCGTLSTRIRDAMRAEGFEDAKGWQK